MRGRPPKKRLELQSNDETFEQKGENLMPELPVKHLARGINKKGMYGNEGDVPAEVVEKELEKYYNKGYRLKAVYMVSNAPDYINLLYILTIE